MNLCGLYLKKIKIDIHNIYAFPPIYVKPVILWRIAFSFHKIARYKINTLNWCWCVFSYCKPYEPKICLVYHVARIDVSFSPWPWNSCSIRFWKGFYCSVDMKSTCSHWIGRIVSYLCWWKPHNLRIHSHYVVYSATYIPNIVSAFRYPR